MMARNILLILIVWQSTAGLSFSDDTVAVRPALVGKVTDQDGKPLAGVRVDISTAAPKVGSGIFCPSCYLDCGKWATTNEAGEFELKELDSTLKFRLLIASPGRVTAQTDLVDPQEGPVDR